MAAPAPYMTWLLKQCVKSVVYHLKNDLKKMDEADSILLDEEKKSNDGATASKATKEKVRKAQDQLWHSVNRFMWILGDRKTVAWIKVKEEGNPTPNFRWIKVD